MTSFSHNPYPKGQVSCTILTQMGRFLAQSLPERAGFLHNPYPNGQVFAFFNGFLRNSTPLVSHFVTLSGFFVTFCHKLTPLINFSCHNLSHHMDTHQLWLSQSVTFNYISCHILSLTVTNCHIFLYQRDRFNPRLCFRR